MSLEEFSPTQKPMRLDWNKSLLANACFETEVHSFLWIPRPEAQEVRQKENIKYLCTKVWPCEDIRKLCLQLAR